MLRILVVEDTPKHLEDAIRVGQELGVEVITRTCFADAVKFLTWSGGGKVDGVISDIFIPFSSPEEAERGHEGKLIPDQPCGLGITAIAEAIGIPCVLCTSGHHHGDKFQWITSVGRFVTSKRKASSCWDMVDGKQSGGLGINADAPTKDWEVAFGSILFEIKRSKIQK